MRLDNTEATVARAADAVEQQTQNMTALTANVQRLERAGSELASNIASMLRKTARSARP
jgi:cell division protein FtsB